MYTPPKFRVDDPQLIKDFIRENQFGLLLSHTDGEIHDTHTPFIVLENGSLQGHIARANPQWQQWQGQHPVKVVFTGPHAYISPHYYASDFNVPTWNYTAVSVTGRVSIIEDQSRILEFLDRLVAQNETSDAPWKLDRDDEHYTKLLAAIVVFSVSVDRVDASFKLNQNKAVDDQKHVIQSLSGSGCPFDGAVADMMNSNVEQADR